MINPASQPVFLHHQTTPSIEDDTGSAHSLSRSRRNIGEPAKYWPQNSTIKIAMYDYDMDDEYVLAVKKAASEWLPHINLKFEFVAGEEGNVRITQNVNNNSEGSSAIGTDALDRSPAHPTMALPRDHRHPRFAYIVRHEFGHMLGAHHAHQHPDANIPWDMEKVNRMVGLSQQEVERNLLPLPRSSKYDFTTYDGDSVMHYEINPALTHGGWGQSESWTLSDEDIAWAKKAYPKTTPAIS
ncbi:MULTISPECIES: M12 family metallopeptidase [Pseudomonas]|uniref:Peptidase M12 n=1 Tax=Pseudomonas orientalis TaxID=76758 RepID=A0A4Q7CXU9_9PSED|nr:MULTISPECIES: M12 family metallopeptidase [Pseudomonas]RZI31264.1 peptidase M12 [Pseudomonas orientalis]CRM43621.1 Astacin (Peptidase family M12A) [Pseudomonas sp. 44 R 15]